MAQTLYARALPSQLAAPVDRYINGVLSEGVWDLAGNHFQVVQQASPGMSVRCGSGTAGDMAVVEGDAALQGSYIVQNQDAYVGSGNTDLSIGNGDPSDPRIDLVVLRVYDDEMDSSGSTVAQVEVVPGTPASSPSVPATPDGAIALGSVLVAAGESTSITSGDITDLRGQSEPAGPIGTYTFEEFENWTADARTTSASEGALVAHTGVATVTNPGRAVKIYAMQTFDLVKGSGVGDVRLSNAVEISTDGGSTWTTGTDVDAYVGSSQNGGGAGAAYHFVSATPTGDVQVRFASERLDAESGSVNAAPRGGYVRVIRA